MEGASDVASKLPTEAWYLIADNLLELRDVAHLAEVCKRLCSIIGPHHLKFRSLSAFTDESCLWDALSSNSLNAQCVRQLFVVDRTEAIIYNEFRLHWRSCPFRERQQGVKRWECPIPDLCRDNIRPEGFPMDTREVDARPRATYLRLSKLPAALLALHRVQKVGLCIWLSQLLEFGIVFESLGPSVDSLEVHVISSTGASEDHEACRKVIQRLRGGYRVFSFICSAYEDMAGQLLEIFEKLLVERCPALEELSLSISEPPFDGEPGPVRETTFKCEYMWDHEWPQLQHLSLDGICCEISDGGKEAPAFREFSVRHNLRTLRMVGLHGENLGAVSGDVLPALQEIETDVFSDFVKSLFEPLSDGSYRPIKALGFHLGIEVASEIYDLEEVVFNAGRLQTLVSLTVTRRQEASNKSERGSESESEDEDSDDDEESSDSSDSSESEEEADPEAFMTVVKVLGIYLPNLRYLKLTHKWQLSFTYPWPDILARYPGLCEAQIGWMGEDVPETDPDPAVADQERLDALNGLAKWTTRLYRVDDWFKYEVGKWRRVERRFWVTGNTARF